MTAREWMQKNMPKFVDEEYVGGVYWCPHMLFLLEDRISQPDWCCSGGCSKICAACWDRELPEVTG